MKKLILLFFFQKEQKNQKDEWERVNSYLYFGSFCVPFEHRTLFRVILFAVLGYSMALGSLILFHRTPPAG